MSGDELTLCAKYLEAQPSQRRQRQAKVDSVVSLGKDKINRQDHRDCTTSCLLVVY